MTNEEIINYFIGDAYGPLNGEVILFVDYKKDYYTLDLFVSVFNEYLKDEAKSEIENFMKDYKQWNYYIIKELFRLLKSKYLLKD